uniref:Helicase ATP-binding domain-containing protein n=1 Tax=Echinostoma caproni TaxID=27848 RepID=A0A183AH75_9TREM
LYGDDDDEGLHGNAFYTIDRSSHKGSCYKIMTFITLQAQPSGNTLTTGDAKVSVPFLLTGGSLREYQLVGLTWLAAIFQKRLNGILADEMGLGKTIQTIALLAYLACEHGIWGPHLIVVPTSVILNWEIEFKRWCPGFKILTYFGHIRERRERRKGWTKTNAFHVCITSYRLAIQDAAVFKRKKWKYLILDEAQNIKNFKSQRWQTLLTFNSQRRLLLTGTPLQNSLMELWSLMHFLMPNIFQSHRDFQEWFASPLTGMIEGNSEYNEQLVARLHKVLRPFLLRRLKADVERQMPKKFEHIVMCRLSRRQRFLYDDFMSLTSTRETLKSGQFLSVMNVLMQLRKVCNHPNLFETRPIISSFHVADYLLQLDLPRLLVNISHPFLVFASSPNAVSSGFHINVSSARYQSQKSQQEERLTGFLQAECLPKVCIQQDLSVHRESNSKGSLLNQIPLSPQAWLLPVQLHRIATACRIQFPDPRLIQYDCGKLQRLDLLLRELKAGSHRVLIFTQMARMLDILEQFLAYHGHRYLRLDGATKVEQRQVLMERFNQDASIFVFILSTRSGGLGVNLTGADTVIFYDSDWNPTMDAQAQDRCHRIGQTRDVHIYRLISELTVEENILRKANQKRFLSDVAIEGGRFTTAFFKQNTIDELFAEPSGLQVRLLIACLFFFRYVNMAHYPVKLPPSGALCSKQ